MKSYLELSEEQRRQADKMYYLLGRKVDEKVFFERNGQIDAVNSLAIEQSYTSDHGYFCFGCRKVFLKADSHAACSPECPESIIIPVRTKEQAHRLLELKTFREQLEE